MASAPRFCRAPYILSGSTAQSPSPAGTGAPVLHRRVSRQHAGVRCSFAAVPKKSGLHLSCAAAPSSSVAGSQSGRAAMRAPSNQALLSARSLKLPIRLGAYNMRLHKGQLLQGQLLQGCIRSTQPSPPAAVVSLCTCAQGSAATTAGPLGSVLGPRPRLRPGHERAAASVGCCTSRLFLSVVALLVFGESYGDV
ncbi:hypothetical protein NDU88_005819 [Pleurodeles waltl]|uniref:Uncharacterized protein n=1 Tax=Pleurodeles waltl TaxID=8319 RepID=A0AAV7PJ46_PLEWA|nr:hypothetical protein NDU88_005819 [Pleurodeles waltl]